VSQEGFTAAIAAEEQRAQRPTENRVGDLLLDAAMQVHRRLGPGLLESTYEACLAHELSKRGLRMQRQHLIPIQYDDLKIENAYRVDLVLDNLVVVELKAVEGLLPVHRAQLLGYLKLDGYRLGYLLNFNVPRMRDGIVRLANGL
jgi:GxxExxY protein